MKILFDATELSYYNDNDGHKAGVFYVALNLFKEFKKMGVDLTFVCDFRRYYFLKNIKEFENIALLEENSFLNRLWGKLIYKTRNFPIRIKYAILILARFYDAFFYKCNKGNSEQLKGFDVYFSPYTPPSKEIQDSEIKKFRMLHDAIPIMENGCPKSPKDWYYKIYNSINDKDFYVTNSDYTKKDILKYFPNLDENNIKTTLLGANENFCVSKKPSPIEGKYVFSLCTLGKRKNLEFVIRNFFDFIKNRDIKDLKLVLGGSVWHKYKKELSKILEKYDKSKIILSGYINEEELSSYYSNALCFVYPSLYEGFGLPVLEAMSCGCPVITSETSSLPEVIGDTGIKINPKNDKEMIEALERMYYDNIFRALCSERGLERAKEFSWEKCAKEITDFITSKNTPIK